MEDVGTKKVEFDRDALQKAVMEEKSERAKRCMDRIQKVLDEERCILEVRPQLVSAGSDREGSPMFGFTAIVGSKAL